MREIVLSVSRRNRCFPSPGLLCHNPRRIPRPCFVPTRFLGWLGETHLRTQHEDGHLPAFVGQKAAIAAPTPTHGNVQVHLAACGEFGLRPASRQFCPCQFLQLEVCKIGEALELAGVEPATSPGKSGRAAIVPQLR